MMKGCALLTLAVVAVCYLGKASADNITFAVKNSRSDEIFPRLMVAGSSGLQIIDYPPVPSNGTIDISVGHDSHSVLLFRIGCSQINGQVKCISGDCPRDDCVKERPIDVTAIEYNKGTLTISAIHGYNVAVKLVFQGSGGNCSSISCVLPLDKCLEHHKIWQGPKERGQPRMLVACTDVTGLSLPPGQDCAMPGSYDYPPTAGTCCEFKNGIWQVIVG